MPSYKHLIHPSRACTGTLALLRRLASTMSAMSHSSGAFYAEIAAASGVFKFYVDGQWRESESGKAVGNTNPSTRQLAYNVQGEGMGGLVSLGRVGPGVTLTHSSVSFVRLS